jgi:hypothetical protein
MSVWFSFNMFVEDFFRRCFLTDDFREMEGDPLKVKDLYSELFDAEFGIVVFSLFHVEKEKSGFTL